MWHWLNIVQKLFFFNSSCKQAHKSLEANSPGRKKKKKHLCEIIVPLFFILHVFACFSHPSVCWWLYAFHVSYVRGLVSVLLRGIRPWIAPQSSSVSQLLNMCFTIPPPPPQATIAKALLHFTNQDNEAQQRLLLSRFLFSFILLSLGSVLVV